MNWKESFKLIFTPLNLTIAIFISGIVFAWIAALFFTSINLTCSDEIKTMLNHKHDEYSLINHTHLNPVEQHTHRYYDGKVRGKHDF